MGSLTGARIVHVLGETGIGGAENQALYLLGALSERGVAPEVAFFRKGRQHAEFAALGLTMHHVEARRRLALDGAGRTRRLMRLLDGNPPDILHTWLYESHLIGLAAALRWPQTRVVLAHRSGHGVPGTRRQLLALRPFRGRINHAVANSQAGAEVMLRFGITADRVSVIENGVPANRVAVQRSREAVRRELGIPPDVAVVCSVTRPTPEKDLPTLFEAFASVRAVRPDAHLLLVGPTVSELEAFGMPLPPGSHAIGFHTRPSDLMNSADVVAVSSRTEGHSNVAAEALMLGMPVASTATGDHAALVTQAGGRIVPVEQPTMLAAALLDLLERPPERERVRAAVRQHLSITHVADSMIDLYERLLDDQDRPPLRPAVLSERAKARLRHSARRAGEMTSRG